MWRASCLFDGEIRQRLSLVHPNVRTTVDDIHPALPLRTLDYGNYRRFAQAVVQFLVRFSRVHSLGQ